MSIASNFPSSLPSLLLDFANVKRLDPRITFTRTTTATYYDGVTTAKAEENLLTYSQEFDNAVWTKSNITVTANSTTAPDGTSTADTVTENTSNSPHSINFGSVAPLGTNTISIYAKNNGRYLVLALSCGGLGASQFVSAVFDLSGGTVTASNQTGSQTLVGAAVTSVGSGWYRCSVTGTFTAAVDLNISLSNVTTAPTGDYGRGSYTGNGTSGAYIWGAQAEIRSSATAYTATTSQAITNYIPVLQTASAGQARFDHNPTTGESLGLLIEEARTNLFTYSADFSSWSLNNGAIQSNVIVAPDGTLTGDKYAVGTTNGNNAVYRAATTTAVSHTFSVIAKAGELSFLILTSPVFGYRTYFNLSTGVIGSVAANHTATMTGVGNGWYRCTVTMTTLASTTNWAIEATNTDGVNVYVGNNFNGIFIWGAQLEAGSFATSYIPTVASSVTRNADAASMTGTNFSSWFNNGEGTVYFEAQPMYVGAGVSSLNSWLWDGTTNNFIGIGQNNSYGNGVGIDGIVRVNGSNTVYGSTTTGVTTSSAFKVTMAYEVDNTGSYLNGASFIADTSCTIPVVNQWKFSGNYVSGNTSNGWVRKLSYYPQRLSATNLAALTT